MRKYLQVLLPVAFLLASLFILVILYLARPKATLHPVVDQLPVVSVVVARAHDRGIPVSARGRVMPFREQYLQADSSGYVSYLAPGLMVGGGVREGELLVVIDDLQMESKIRHGSVDELKAEQALLQTERESVHRGQSAEANRSVEAPENSARLQEQAAHLHVAELQKQNQRARIVAPFDGWVMADNVVPGMFVQPGMVLAKLFAESSVDIRVTLSTDLLELLDLPTAYAVNQERVSTAVISLLDAGQRYYWHGVVTGTEGRVDELSRQSIVHVRIYEPYAADPEQIGRPELRLGLLVDVEFKGREFSGLYEVPRGAIHNGNQFWIVNENDRLEQRSVDILYKGRKAIFASGGVGEGDRIVMTQLNHAAEGLHVVVDDQQSESAL